MLNWARDKLSGNRQKLANFLNRRSPVLSGNKNDMFVSDANIFSSDLVKLCVINREGATWNVDASPDFTVERLKSMALCHFYNPQDAMKAVGDYKLVLVSERRTLDNDNSVLAEKLKENDELLLLPKRQQPAKEVQTEESMRGPNESEIKAATEKLEEQNFSNIVYPPENSPDFQTEIRKILVTLVEASARILAPNPDAAVIFNQICERLDSKSKPKPDPSSIKQLMDMGFSEKQAVKALRFKKMNQSEALEWLLEHADETESSSTDAAPVTSPSVEERLSLETTLPELGEASGGGLENESEPKDQDILVTAPESRPRGRARSVGTLLESFRAYRRQEFRPNKKALENLIEMGFPREEVLDALRVAGNNQDTACEWLLGERKPTVDDLDGGLDATEPLYKAIMSNPAIQLSLTNPRMLLVFLSMLENPSSANMWINDPDASPVLSQIFKTYHAEKHALQINKSRR